MDSGVPATKDSAYMMASSCSALTVFDAVYAAGSSGKARPTSLKGSGGKERIDAL